MILSFGKWIKKLLKSLDSMCNQCTLWHIRHVKWQRLKHSAPGKHNYQRAPCRPFWMSTRKRNLRITPACPHSKTGYQQLTVCGYTRSYWLEEVRLDKLAFHDLQDMAQNTVVFSGNFDTALDEITRYYCRSLTQCQLPATTPTCVFACSGWVMWGAWENLWSNFKYLFLNAPVYPLGDLHGKTLNNYL